MVPCLQPRIRKAGVVPLFGPSRVRFDLSSRPPESLAMMSCLCARKTRMRKTIASIVLSLALMSSDAMANDRAGDPVSGALSKIGHAARTLAGYIAEPFIARSGGSRRSSATHQPKGATEAEPSSRVSDSPPAPRITQTDAPTGVPPIPRSTAALPPVQPLE